MGIHPADHALRFLGVARAGRGKRRRLGEAEGRERGPAASRGVAVERRDGHADHPVLHEPSPLNQALANLCTLVFFGGIFLSIFGEKVVPAPAWDLIKEYKMLCFGAMFVCNAFAGQLIATGAFEVDYDSAMVFSKIETGDFPRDSMGRFTIQTIVNELRTVHKL